MKSGNFGQGVYSDWRKIRPKNGFFFCYVPFFDFDETYNPVRRITENHTFIENHRKPLGKSYL